MTTYVLSVPPSANKLFANTKKQWARLASSSASKKRGRVRTKEYTAWVDGELKSLLAQRAKPVAVPVKITIQKPRYCRKDLDNIAKPVIDLLVRGGIIEDDGPDFVHGITIEPADIESMKVSIETCAPRATAEAKAA